LKIVDGLFNSDSFSILNKELPQSRSFYHDTIKSAENQIIQASSRRASWLHLRVTAEGYQTVNGEQY
jgi:hypothetical protein